MDVFIQSREVWIESAVLAINEAEKCSESDLEKAEYHNAIARNYMLMATIVRPGRSGGMKIVRVRYEATINKGSYENEKIALEAELEEGDDAAEAIASLRAQVLEMAGAQRGWGARKDGGVVR